MSDEQYVEALLNGRATIEYRSERVLVAEVKRLRGEVAALSAVAKASASMLEEADGELNQATELLHKSNVAAADDAKTIAELRAELADSQGDAMNLQSIIDELRRETNALTQTMAACNEVAAKYKTERDWFRKRERPMQAAFEALSEHAGAINDGVYATAYQEWLEANPKPGTER